MKVYFKTYGCRVNQIETQSMTEKFFSAGAEKAEELSEADIIVVNSCCVTEKADRDVLNFIKKTTAENPTASLAVTGCYATLFPSKILEINEKALIFPNPEKDNLVSKLTGVSFSGDFSKITGFEGKTRAFVKIQDGCDLKCSYCIVPYGRSELKSKKSSLVLEEIKNLVKNGFKEITLSGTRLGYYLCPERKLALHSLLSEIFLIDGDFRIRLSSLEPMEINEKIISVLFQAGKKFCDHFHLPLQSGSEDVLRAMKRPYGKNFFYERVGMIRDKFPMAGIFSDIIAGFPLEGENEFAETCSFLRSWKPAGLHVFTFSSRPGTAAAAYPGHSPAVKKRRSEKLHELDREFRNSFSSALIGKKLRAITLKRKGEFTLALSSNFQNVFLSEILPANELIEVEIKGFPNGFLAGVRIEK